jgi:hypothetical protein
VSLALPGAGLPLPATGWRQARVAGAFVLLLLVAVTGAACQPTLHQATGIVVAVDSPALGAVDGFELRADDGATMAFDTRGLRFGEGFPAAHLAEHQAVAEPVRVTYRIEGGRNVVVRLDDAD